MPDVGPIAVAHAREVAQGARFEFGANWRRFLDVVDDARIAGARESLRSMLGVESLEGRRFADVGCGSGLFSLAARSLGARVHSFDYDPDSVACTAELRSRLAPGDPEWRVEAGSILDSSYVGALGRFDIVYSWGVLHHTGDMWRALEQTTRLVAPDGLLFIALYNDQGPGSRAWAVVKRAYNALPRGTRWIVLIPALVRLWGPTMVRDLLAGKPLRSWREYGRGSGGRGMSAWHDVVDWVGGWPFEVARVEAVQSFLEDRGFVSRTVKSCGRGRGCNEYVFRKKA